MIVHMYTEEGTNKVHFQTTVSVSAINNFLSSVRDVCIFVYYVYMCFYVFAKLST